MKEIFQKIIFGIICVLAAGGYLYAEQSDVEISVFSNKNAYLISEPVILNATIKNNTKEEILFVGPQDGSENKFRYPFCYFEVKDKNGEIVKDDYPACKVVNPLTKEAFHIIKHGGIYDFFEDGFNLSRIKTLKPGIYLITLYYSTDAKKESQWYGLYADDYWETRNTNEFWKKREKEMKEIRGMLKKVPVLNMKSNTITIEIIKDKDVSKEDALKIAEEVCKEQGWDWVDVNIIDKEDYWDINTHKTRLGGNAFIRIEKKTGKVLDNHLTGP